METRDRILLFYPQRSGLAESFLVSGSDNNNSYFFTLVQNRLLQPKNDNQSSENHRGKREKDKGYGWFETVKIILQE